jgi:uncharacterized membrane protein
LSTQHRNGAFPSSRFDAIDVARGVAVAAMVVYHFGWDLSFLRLIATDLIRDPAWRWFARGIAGSFLALAGIGLALAHAQGFRPHSFLRRLAKIAGAAALVSVATYFVFPESYIFFGILHCIAVSSVLALPFLRAPIWTAAVAAAICFTAPLIARSPFWDHDWLDWLGLGAQEPFTNDYVPIFPWFGLVLLGLAAARGLLPPGTGASPRPPPETTLPSGQAGPGLDQSFASGTDVPGGGARKAIVRWQAKGRLALGLTWAGRRSLPIYLVHQVILFGALYGLAQIIGPNPTAEARPFIEQCKASCGLRNGSRSTCETFCSCIVDNLRRDGSAAGVLNGTAGSDEQARIARSAQQCLVNVPPN